MPTFVCNACGRTVENPEETGDFIFQLGIRAKRAWQDRGLVKVETLPFEKILTDDWFCEACWDKLKTTIVKKVERMQRQRTGTIDVITGDINYLNSTNTTTVAIDTSNYISTTGMVHASPMEVCVSLSEMYGIEESAEYLFHLITRAYMCIPDRFRILDNQTQETIILVRDHSGSFIYIQTDRVMHPRIMSILEILLPRLAHVVEQSREQHA